MATLFCRSTVLLNLLFTNPGVSFLSSRRIEPMHKNPVGQFATLSSLNGANPPSRSNTETLVEEADYVVIGSGIGGLSCAAMLAYYGHSVVVLESHYLPGGCAHTFEVDGFSFDAGPSLWNGMATRPYNPLREILELVGEGDSVKYNQYDGWVMHTPDGSFKFTVGKGKFEEIIQQFGGPNALNEWTELGEALKPVMDLSCAIPPLALRCDPGVLLTLLPYVGLLAWGAPVASRVEGSFKDISKNFIKDKFLENWFEFLAFALSGLPAYATIAAAVAYTMRDLHQTRAALDYPIGGSIAVVNALINGFTKYNPATNKIYLNSHVEEIIVDDSSNEATGVLLRNKKVIKAKRGVVSNASIWDTYKLIPTTCTAISAEDRKNKMDTPRTGSFVHLHVGIDATGLPPDLESHYTVINKWDPIDAPQNHVIISIPSVLDPSLAPPGCHVIHAYAAANEPYELWEKMEANYRQGAVNKEKYDRFKQERCEFLFRAIERSIPDLRSRIKVELLASPFTHARFNRRYKGTFGPAWKAGQDKFPYPNKAVSNIKKLLVCGDSVFPGIGVPAVAASGANAASSSVSVFKHLNLMQDLRRIRGDI